MKNSRLGAISIWKKIKIWERGIMKSPFSYQIPKHHKTTVLTTVWLVIEEDKYSEIVLNIYGKLIYDKADILFHYKNDLFNKLFS